MPSGLTLQHRTWIEVLPLMVPSPVAMLTRLDVGEAAVITMALELGSPVVLIDEKKGLRIAREQGLQALGSVGILLLAKRGLLLEVKPHLHVMHARGIRLSN